MNRIARSLLVAVLAVLLLGPAMITHAQVQIIEQFAEIKLSSNAHCLGEAGEPNVQEILLHDLNGVDVAPSTVLNSLCGSARASAQLIVEYGSNVIEGRYAVRDVLLGFGSANAEFTADIQLQVDSPTEVTIYSRGDLLDTDYMTYSDGELLETGKTQSNSSSFVFSGKNVTVISGGLEWDEQWTRTLQPGSVYTLRMQMSTSRFALLLGEEYSYSDGSTLKEGTFRLEFDATVVRNDSESWGTLKARY